MDSGGSNHNGEGSSRTKPGSYPTYLRRFIQSPHRYPPPMMTTDPWRTDPVDSSNMKILMNLGRKMPSDTLEWNTIRNWGTIVSEPYKKVRYGMMQDKLCSKSKIQWWNNHRLVALSLWLWFRAFSSCTCGMSFVYLFLIESGVLVHARKQYHTKKWVPMFTVLTHVNTFNPVVSAVCQSHWIPWRVLSSTYPLPFVRMEWTLKT